MGQDDAAIDLPFVFKKGAAELLRLKQRAGGFNRIDRLFKVRDRLRRSLSLKEYISYVAAGALDRRDLPGSLSQLKGFLKIRG